MMNKIFIFITITSFVYLLSSCGHDKPAPLNPNGDTELALLMRAMYDEGMVLKEDLAEGKNLDLHLKHAKILTAEATEPKKAASPEFKSFADYYLLTVQELKNSKNPDPHKAYDAMVTACMNCHEAMCPGPIVKIKKMVRDESIGK
jgi:5-methylcytosine-specific restriction endonuclease McrA